MADGFGTTGRSRGIQRGEDGQRLGCLPTGNDGLSALTDGGPEDAERAQIESWLGKDCGTCHGPAASPGAGSALSTLDGAGDVRELLEAGLIVPCDPEGSPLVQELRDTSMPPLGVSAHQPDRSMLRRLISFIARPCAR